MMVVIPLLQPEHASIEHIDYQSRGLGILMRDRIINHVLRLFRDVGCRLIILYAVEDKK
jgi:hypothetical protein